MNRLERKRLFCTLLIISFIFGQIGIIVVLKDPIFIRVFPRNNLGQRLDKQALEGFPVPRLFGCNDTYHDLKETSSISNAMIPQIARSVQEGGSVTPVILIYSSDSTTLYNRDQFDNETKTILESLGFNVIIEDRFSIPVLNSSHFKNVTQFWIVNGWDGSPFTESEKNLIIENWRRGIDLVLLGDETGFYTNVNMIGNYFGVEFEGAYGFPDPQTPNFSEHPIWINVSTIYANPTLPQLTIYANSSAQSLSTELGYNQHVLFENGTGTVFWGSSFGNFMNEHVTKYDNSQYVSNLARHLQEPNIILGGAVNNSFINNDTILHLQIIDDNLKNVSYNWDGGSNQSMVEPYDISLPSSDGWHDLNICVLDYWNHSIHIVYHLNKGTPKIHINEINYDTPGNDTASDEFIELHVIEGGFDPSYWYITDWDDNNYWEIPSSCPVVSSGEMIILHLGNGTDDDKEPVYHYYMGETVAQLNNSGEPLTLFGDDDSSHDRTVDIAYDFVAYGSFSENELISADPWNNWPNNGINPTESIESVGAEYESLQLLGNDLDNKSNWYSAKPTIGYANKLTHSFTEDFGDVYYINEAVTTITGWGLGKIQLSLNNNTYSVNQDTNDFARNIATSGNYAFIADGNSGLAIIDVSTPTDPKQPIYCSTNDYAYDVQIYGNYAFIADGNSGLAIIDVSTPTDPNQPIYRDINGSALSIYVNDGFAYIGTFDSKLAIVNVSDPTAPSEPVYVIIDYIYDYTIMRGIHVADDYVYLAATSLEDSGGHRSSALVIVNVSDPLNPSKPVYKGLLYKYPNQHVAYDVCVSGDYAFIALWDETFPNRSLVAINVTNPMDPGILINYANISEYGYGMFVSDNFLFLAAGWRGLVVFDVSNPPTLGEPIFIDINKTAWGIFVDNNYAFVALGSSGLGILEMELQSPAIVQTSCLYNSTGFVQNVTVVANQSIPPNTTIYHYISVDDSTWIPVILNETYSFKLNTHHELYWRAVLEAEKDQILSPEICSIIIDFDIYFDQEPPTINLVNIQNNTLINPDIAINLSINDFTFEKSWFCWDGGSNYSIVDPFVLSPPTTEGYHWLTVYANDSVGYLTIKRYRWWVDLLPVIRLISPVNGTVQKYGTTLILSIEDTSLDAAWFSWDDDGEQHFGTTWNITLELPDGWHTLSVFANDTNGYLTTIYYYFYCDVLTPVITLIGMQNNTVISSTANIRLNATDFSLETVWINWDNDFNQTLSSSQEVNTSIQEGYHWLLVYANDSFGHLSWKKFLFYINYPPVIQLETFPNNSIILSSMKILLNITDLTLTKVWFQWEPEGNTTITQPFEINVSGKGWKTLIITASDTWGSTATKKYIFYILTSAMVETTQPPPSTAYDGERFVYSFTITNPESIYLNLSLFIYGGDDTVLQGNGSQIILAPGESQIIEIGIIPRHASTHQLLIILFHEGQVYHQFTLIFNVEPQWMSPRFYIPFIMFPLILIGLFVIIIGLSTFFIQTRKRIHHVLTEELKSTSDPISLQRIQASVRVPSFMIHMAVKSNHELTLSPTGDIVSTKLFERCVKNSLAAASKPIRIDEICSEYGFKLSKILSIVNNVLREGVIQGKIVKDVFYPEVFFTQVSQFISTQQAGSLSEVLETFQIDQQIAKIVIEQLLESDSIFTVYLNPQQDLFTVIQTSAWYTVGQQLASASGFIPGNVLPSLTIHHWRTVFRDQQMKVVSYNDRLYSIEGLQAYAPDHLDEITHIMQTLRRQLPQLSLPSHAQREVLRGFELLLPCEPVLLPYYCQMDSAMIVKETSAFVCMDCNRYICPTCYRSMTDGGMETCINCGGDLVERPAIQLEMDIMRVDQMTGQEFENFLEGLFRTQGYRVANIQSSGDHGVDLVVIKGEARTCVQAKRYKPSSKIGNQVLIKLMGGGFFHDCANSMVVTTSYFTRKAREYAQKVGIELWDRDDLTKYLIQYNKHL